MPAQPLAHLLSSRAIGSEEDAVHASRPKDEALETQLLQALDGGARRDERLSRQVVKPAQIAPDRSSGPSHTVVPAVLVEIGVEARDRGDLALQDMPQQGQAQRRLGRDVDEVRLEGVERPPD
jgi:hypothetical protein